MIAILRRLRPTRERGVEWGQLPSDRIPQVWMDEDGEDYWAAGHVDPYRFVLAVIAQHLLDVGTEETVEILFASDLLLARAAYGNSLLKVAELVASVEHLWHLDLDDELWHPCTASHPGAMPVTRLPIF